MGTPRATRNRVVSPPPGVPVRRILGRRARRGGERFTGETLSDARTIAERMRQEAARGILSLIRSGSWFVPGVAWSVGSNTLVARPGTFARRQRQLLEAVGNTAATRLRFGADDTVRLLAAPGTGRGIIAALEAVASGETAPGRAALAPTFSVDVSRVPVVEWITPRWIARRPREVVRPGEPGGYLERFGRVDGYDLTVRVYPAADVIATWVGAIPRDHGYSDATTTRSYKGRE